MHQLDELEETDLIIVSATVKGIQETYSRQLLKPCFGRGAVCLNLHILGIIIFRIMSAR